MMIFMIFVSSHLTPVSVKTLDKPALLTRDEPQEKQEKWCREQEKEEMKQKRLEQEKEKNRKKSGAKVRRKRKRVTYFVAFSLS